MKQIYINGLSKKVIVPLLTLLLFCGTTTPAMALSNEDIAGAMANNPTQVEIEYDHGLVGASTVEGYAVVKNFSDLNTTHWAYDAVSAMITKEIVKGYANGIFKPNEVVTYGEFIKMVDIAVTGTDIGNSTTGNWAQKYYDQAVEKGYFTKTAITSSKLSSQIPRSDMALIISGALGSSVTADTKLVSNLSDVSASNIDILKVYGAGIITGYTDGTFKPTGTLTRAEAATVMWRLVDTSKRVIPTVKETGVIKPDVTEVIKETTDSIQKQLVSECKGYVILDAFNNTWAKVEQSGNKYIDIKNPTGLNDLYWYKDGKLVSSIKKTKALDGMIRICYYRGSEGVSGTEYTNAKNCPYIASYHWSTGILTIMPNPLYGNI